MSELATAASRQPPAGFLRDTPSLPELAYRYLREGILSRRLDIGMPLRQEEIAAELGISRLPVREALRRLEVEGLVLLRPRRGYVVASLNADEIRELFDIRAMLEERAGFLATERRTDDDVEALSVLCARLAELVHDEMIDAAEFAVRNRDFHERLYATSGRNHLCRMLMTLRDSVERYARMGASMSSSLKPAQDEHHRILEAFRTGDAVRVGQLCRTHCENTCRRLIGYLESSADLTQRSA